MTPSPHPLHLRLSFLVMLGGGFLPFGVPTVLVGGSHLTQPPNPDPKSPPAVALTLLALRG